MKKVNDRAKRLKRRKRRIIAKAIAKLSIPFAAVIMACTFIFNSFKDLGLINSKENYDDYIIEETEEVEEVEEIENVEKMENSTITVVDDVINEVIEETKEIEEIVKPLEEEISEPEPVEYIGTDLLDMDYEFQNIDFDSLMKDSPDTVGWIHIDGTKVDYPIMQGEDNEYYSHRDINGNKSSLGSIYLDANNDLSKSTLDLDDLNFIYGHHIIKGRMFSTICYYKDQTFAEEYPFIVIYTPDGYAYKGDVFAGVLYDGTDVSLFNEYKDFENEETFEDYMSYIKANSVISTNVDVEYGDKIVALVTCSYENGMDGNLRFVVFTRLSKQYTSKLQMEESAKLSLHK